ncbi:glycosyltransferase family 4 protein [Azospirillum sp. SYSU D00513]|uniref:MraY family glycosyltransferase n=1 Tax=Azospirillum sp. SYSU D00513 TaxID=2812561 RepID=UPI001A95E3AD|nr:glycosyltransferase family 4 protein [Azospirillum sp. SYSU D00513]
MDIVERLAALAGAFGLCGIAAWRLSPAVLRYLTERRILDVPNARSSHQKATPRGGGWAIVLTALPALALIGAAYGWLGQILPVLTGAAALIAVSWVDDRRTLSARLRFAVQAACVALGLLVLPADALVLQGLLPWWADRALTALAWLWFINLYNFMDGIDGLAGSETVLIGTGIASLSLAVGAFPPLGVAGAALAGAAAGFLTHNWSPARMFMGDVGSVPLGYLLGFLLISLSLEGHWIAALILPAYYLTDATVTLLRRALRGEEVWKAHREHFYQRAADGIKRHDRVVLTIIAYSLGLVAAAVLSPSAGPWTLLAAALLVAALIASLRRMAGLKTLTSTQT